MSPYKVYAFIMHCQLSFKKDFANLYMCACLAYFLKLIHIKGHHAYNQQNIIL